MNPQKSEKQSTAKKILLQTLTICFLIGLIWFFKTLPGWIIEREMEKQLALIPKPAEIPVPENPDVESGHAASSAPNPVAPGKTVPEIIIPEEIIYDALRHINDPEIDINLVDLGLIREVQSDEKGISVTMILTTRFCPYQGNLVGSVKEAVKKVSQSDAVKINVDYSRTWSTELMSEAGKKQWEHFFRNREKK